MFGFAFVQGDLLREEEQKKAISQLKDKTKEAGSHSVLDSPMR